jgi:hypothetical protein
MNNDLLPQSEKALAIVVAALAARFKIVNDPLPTFWNDLDPAERKRLWRRALRKSRTAYPPRRRKPELLFPDLWK